MIFFLILGLVMIGTYLGTGACFNLMATFNRVNHRHAQGRPSEWRIGKHATWLAIGITFLVGALLLMLHHL